MISLPRRTEKVLFPLASRTVMLSSPSLMVTDEAEELLVPPRCRFSGGKRDLVLEGAAASMTLSFFRSPSCTTASSTWSPGLWAATNSLRFETMLSWLSPSSDRRVSILRPPVIPPLMPPS